MSDLACTISSEKHEEMSKEFLKHQVQSDGTQVVDERRSKSMRDMSLPNQVKGNWKSPIAW